ncbi:hypothetical protein LUZ60_010796 [Juncus effusus]|nr:hypothetical protein LUZ60_010796 [Juncus effusus]
MTTIENDTALHHAASFGNLEAAKLLVEKDKGLLYLWNSNSCMPLHEAAKCAKREVVSYMLDKIEDDGDYHPFEGHPGIMLVENLVIHGFCDLALTLVQRQTLLATRPKTLESIACHMYQTVDSIFSWTVIGSKMKLHKDSMNLVRFICAELQKINPNEAKITFQSAAKEAARNGIPEIIKEIMIACPAALFLGEDDPSISIFHIAVKHRQHDVFNILFQMSSQRDALLARKDKDGNTILHTAAKLPSSDRLNLAYGAALQIQRELLWYKEVEKLVPAWVKTAANNDGKKPATMFTEQHKDLVEKGEKWIRDTANSGTVAATLIITVAFAAAITVPGGNNSDGLVL